MLKNLYWETSVQLSFRFNLPVFNEKIGPNWPAHLERMYRFWQTILLEEHTYSGSPFPPHKHLPVEKEHFNRWMEIFTETIDALFQGKLAEEAKLRWIVSCNWTEASKYSDKQ